MAAEAALAADIASQGWSCRDDFLPPELIARLRTEASELEARGAFDAAAVGRGEERAVRRDIRGDDTCWLEEPFPVSVSAVLPRLEQLRCESNATLQLGLFDLELHFALYRPGAFYARHRDRFSSGSRRILSLVLYLNEGWREAEGGALRLYLSGESAGNVIEFLPQSGRLVVFLSEQFEHEVLPATRERLSLTGWFLSRAL
jgi:SM-20-related protein